MELRALGTDRIRDVAALGARPEVARYGERPASAPLDEWADWIGEPDPDRQVTLGAFERDALAAAARLRVSSRRRVAHAAALELLVPDAGAEAEVRALAGALVALADRWLQVRRIAHRAPAGHAYAEALAPLGFALEGTLRGSVQRDGALADEDLLARVAPELPAAPPPAFTPPPPGAPLRVDLRPIPPERAPAMTALMSEPRVVWGTLQLPWQRSDLWSARLRSNDPARHWLYGAYDGEALVGLGSVHPGPNPRRRHAGSIGMMVAPPAQGRSVGRQILDALLARADEAGLSRVELSFWDDNHRAERLYRSRGFEAEATERASGHRDGGFADAVVMARLR